MFDPQTDRGRLDYRLMIRAPIVRMLDDGGLDELLGPLADLGYQVHVVEASWLIKEHMFRDLGSLFGGLCHDQWQCLSEALEEFLHPWPRESAGVVLALRGFRTFENSHLDEADSLLGLLAERCWSAAVCGHRLLVLTESSDGPFAARRVELSTSLVHGRQLVHGQEPPLPLTPGAAK